MPSPSGLRYLCQRSLCDHGSHLHDSSNYRLLHDRSNPFRLGYCPLHPLVRSVRPLRINVYS